MYVHASLVSSPAPMRCIPGVECIFVRVRIPSSKPKSNELVVCSVYRPPNAKVEFWELFSLQLDNILRQFSNIIVLGDLNTDVLQPRSGHYKHLRNMCCEFDLRNGVTAPTRHGQTCIDLVLVSTGVQLTQTAVHPVDGISDHDLFFFFAATSVARVFQARSFSFFWTSQPASGRTGDSCVGSSSSGNSVG